MIQPFFTSDYSGPSIRAFGPLRDTEATPIPSSLEGVLWGKAIEFHTDF